MKIESPHTHVLDYSKFSDSNISIFFHEDIASSVRKQNRPVVYLQIWYNFI